MFFSKFTSVYKMKCTLYFGFFITYLGYVFNWLSHMWHGFLMTFSSTLFVHIACYVSVSTVLYMLF